jgi:hypothetical protein
MIPPLFGKQEVGIWRVKKRFPRYGVPISSLWPNIRSLSSIVASFLPSVCPSVLPSFQDIFRRLFLSNCWWQKSAIWSQASYRYTILWVAFLYPSDSYFLFADLVGFYTHWTYMHIFRYIFLSNYWWLWHTYIKLVTKYQIPVINSCWEKCDEKCAYTNVC